MNYYKEAWQPVLAYVRKLHLESQFPPQGVLPYPWENIGPGYCYGPAFGHWDAVHIALDLMDENLEQARNQIDNLISLQQPDGMIPSIVWMRDEAPKDWAPNQTHPPVWIEAAEKIYQVEKDFQWLQKCAMALNRQIAWFEKARKAVDSGFYYTDIKNHLWESGVDEGVRFQDVPEGEKSCVDASSHVYMMYTKAAQWDMELNGKEDPELVAKRRTLGDYVRNHLYDEESGYFYDSWSVGCPECRHLCFEGLWPLIAGIATDRQARRIVENHLMNEKEFFLIHPVPTVSLSDPLYEKRMWRGPAWNSMTMWVALGCMRYGLFAAAQQLLEGALDQTARIYAQTGCIWEFYDSCGGTPGQVARKPHTEYNMPCRDYLGHNPLDYMARLWQHCKERNNDK